MEQKVLTKYEQINIKKKILSFMLIIFIGFSSVTVSADLFYTDTDYGVDYVRGPLSDFIRSMLEKICGAKVTVGYFATYLDYYGVSNTLDTDSDLSLEAFDEGLSEDSETTGIFDGELGLVTVWFSTSNYEISGISIGGTSYSDGTVLTETASIISVANTLCRNVGLAILIITFCLSLMQGYLDGSQYAEIFVKKVIVFGASIALAYSAQYLCACFSNFFSSVAVSFTDLVSTEGVGESEVSLMYAWVYKTLMWPKDEVLGTLDNIAFYLFRLVEALGIVCQFLIPWAIAIGCDIYISFMCISRMIELMLLVALSPLAMTSLSGRGGYENMIRFLKQFMAICLQGVIIIVTIALVSSIRASILGAYFSGDYTVSGEVLTTISNVFDALITIVLVSFVQAGIIGRSRSIATSVMGNM